MGSVFTMDTAKLLLGKLTYEKFVYLALGWWLHAHYKDAIIAMIAGN
jgi:hypothetical protein